MSCAQIFSSTSWRKISTYLLSLSNSDTFPLLFKNWRWEFLNHKNVFQMKVLSHFIEFIECWKPENQKIGTFQSEYVRRSKKKWNACHWMTLHQRPMCSHFSLSSVLRDCHCIWNAVFSTPKWTLEPIFFMVSLLPFFRSCEILVKLWTSASCWDR
jgi:hypothetical protein